MQALERMHISEQHLKATIARQVVSAFLRMCVCGGAPFVFLRVRVLCECLRARACECVDAHILGHKEAEVDLISSRHAADGLERERVRIVLQAARCMFVGSAAVDIGTATLA